MVVLVEQDLARGMRIAEIRPAEQLIHLEPIEPRTVSVTWNRSKLGDGGTVADATPLHRLAKQYQRLGIPMSQPA
jgi:hypothetical protein